MKKNITRFLAASLIVLGFADIAMPSANVAVTNYFKGILNYQVGGNLDFSDWVSGAIDWTWGMNQLGIKILRWETGLFGTFIQDQGQFYPFHNGWQWDAASMACNAQGSFSHQGDFLKSHNMPVVALFNSSLCDAVAYPDHHLNYDEVANYWAGMLNYMVNVKGVSVPFVEIGNEMNVGGGSGMGIFKPNSGLFMNPWAVPPEDTGTITISTQTPQVWGGFDVSRDYKMLWRTVYQAMKAVSPNTLIAGQAGAGLFSQNRLPTLFEGNPRPDLMSVHMYDNCAGSIQCALDDTYYCSMFENDGAGVGSVPTQVMQTQYGYTPTNSRMMLTEWDYDAGSVWNNARQGTWAATYYVSSVAKMVNMLGYEPSLLASTFYCMLPGPFTDQLLDDQNDLSTIGMGMRLFKTFTGPDKRILKTTVVSTDSLNEAGTLFPRVDCIAVKDNSAYRFMLDNQSQTLSHLVTLNLLGVKLTNKPATIQMYYTGPSITNYVPSNTTNRNLVAGSFSLTMPPLGIATITILYGGLTLTNISAVPSLITNSTSRVVVFHVKAYSGAGVVTNISLDLSQFGAGIVKMTNLGVASQFRYGFLVTAGLPVGVKTVSITGYDSGANINLGHNVYVTNVLAPPRIVATNMSHPSIISNGWPNVVVFQLKAKDLNPGTITNVAINLTPIEGSPYARMTNISGHTMFRYAFTVVPGQTAITQEKLSYMVYSSFYGTTLAGIFSFTNWPSNIIPGIVQAENYNRGGEGVAFHDWTGSDSNPGGTYRTNDGINIIPCSAGGYSVSDIQTGEWMLYTVKILSAGLYCIKFDMEGPTSAQYHLELDGVNKTGVWTYTVNPGYVTPVTVASNVVLPAGYHQLKFVNDFGNGYVHINWFGFNYLGPLTGQVSVISYVTNVTLQGNSTGGKLIPGSTALIKVVCTNSMSTPATGAWTCTHISTNSVYVTNSSLFGLPAGWTPEWSTNVNPLQSFISPNYVAVCPAIKSIRWVRWKKTSGGPMSSNSTATFYYSATVK